jgi:hypothetical protein
MSMIGHPVGANFTNQPVSKPSVHFGMKRPSKSAIALISLLAGCGTNSDSREQGATAEPNSLTTNINKPATNTLAFNYANMTCQNAGGRLMMSPVDLGDASRVFDIFPCTPQAGKDRLDMEKIPAPTEVKNRVGILKKLYFAFLKPPLAVIPKNDQGVSF